MNEKYIDLHTHSTKSDGSMTPAEVVRHAAEAGLACIALSDHDSIEGVEEAVATGREVGVEVIPAIELSAQSATETHILGYHVDLHNKKFLDTLEYVKVVRRERIEETCRNLVGLGFDVSMPEVEEMAPGGIIGRAHFAALMVKKGYIGSVKEAFDKYLANGRPAYCDRQALTPEEAVALIHEAGGGAFVAHLHLIRLEDEPLRAFLKRLIDAEGLDGIEGYYTEYTPEMQAKFQGMASDMGLMISGGTDFHAKMKPHISIGTGLGNLRIPYSVAESINAKFKNN